MWGKNLKVFFICDRTVKNYKHKQVSEKLSHVTVTLTEHRTVLNMPKCVWMPFIHTYFHNKLHKISTFRLMIFSFCCDH